MNRVWHNTVFHAMYVAEQWNRKNVAGRKMMMLKYAAGNAGRKWKAAAAAISPYSIYSPI